MIVSLIIIWGLVAVLGVIALRRSVATAREALRIGLSQGRSLILRMMLGILVGACLVEIVPQETLRSAIGEESGLTGILIASVAGGLLPGGPFVSFPIAVAFYKAGVGVPQMMALLTAWSVYAIHRTLNFDLAMMGGRFILLRLASSCLFPPFAGIATALALMVIKLP